MNILTPCVDRQISINIDGGHGHPSLFYGLWFMVSPHGLYKRHLLFSSNLLSVDDPRGGGSAFHVGAAGAGQRAVERRERRECVAVGVR